MESVKDYDMVTNNIINQFKIFYDNSNENSLIWADTNCPADYSKNKFERLTASNKEKH